MPIRTCTYINYIHKYRNNKDKNFNSLNCETLIFLKIFREKCKTTNISEKKT